MSAYRNIMFDLDGTLTDSGRAVMSSVEYALSQLGYAKQPVEKLRTFIGPSLHDSFVREYDMDEESIVKALGLYRDIYEKERMYDVDIYDGIPELLERIKAQGMSALVITSKPMYFTERIMDRIGLARFFDHMVGPDLSDNSSDKKRLIEKAVTDFNLNKDECIMIGDTKYDILGAVQAGIASIGVTYGYGSKEELRNNGASFITADTKGIAQILGI
ncbi:MAG: HAD hydrolase-like protein [Lachnospiraceae bacterium]|nr:HAD hydrolase-like protein [Lachnospiraceae bacterium]